MELIYKDIYFKELTHVIMETGKSKMYRVDQQTGHPGRANIAVQTQRLSAAEFSSVEELIIFILFRPSPEWMRLIHIMEGNTHQSSLIYC